jgi:hypothetical protein
MLINRWCCGCSLASLSNFPHPLPTVSLHLTGRSAVWRLLPHAQGRGAGTPHTVALLSSVFMCGRGCNYLLGCSFSLLPIVPKINLRGRFILLVQYFSLAMKLSSCIFVHLAQRMFGQWARFLFSCFTVLDKKKIAIVQVMENGERRSEKYRFIGYAFIVMYRSLFWWKRIERTKLCSSQDMEEEKRSNIFMCVKRECPCFSSPCVLT